MTAWQLSLTITAGWTLLSVPVGLVLARYLEAL